MNVDQYQSEIVDSRKFKKRPNKLLNGQIIYRNEVIRIAGFANLSEVHKKELLFEIERFGYNGSIKFQEKDLLLDYKKGYKQEESLMSVIGKYFASVNINVNNKKHYKNTRLKKTTDINVETLMDFEEINVKAQSLAFSLLEKKEEIIEVLLNYECYNVAIDEIDRSLDLLLNLAQNKNFFNGAKVSFTASFLPVNQPLYSFVSFGVIPSFMSEKVYIKPSSATGKLFKELLLNIKVFELFTNIEFFYDSREHFIKKIRNSVEVVIFTGKPENAISVKNHLNKEALFILNGAGHNPVIISDNADINKAVASTINLCCYNQGQDCAAPNAILVKNTVIEEYQKLLLEKLQQIEKHIGNYQERKNLIGPNTNPSNAKKIAEFLHKNRGFCLYGGNMNLISGLIYPAVVRKPLSVSYPNMKEFFAPIIMIYTYTEDLELAKYFEHEKYKNNSMYVTLFGESSYVDVLIDKGIHNKESILHNVDLHNSERGFLPYGGEGNYASCIYYKGNEIPGPTLPQREIYIYKSSLQDNQRQLAYNPIIPINNQYAPWRDTLLNYVDHDLHGTNPDYITLFNAKSRSQLIRSNNLVNNINGDAATHQEEQLPSETVLQQIYDLDKPTSNCLTALCKIRHI